MGSMAEDLAEALAFAEGVALFDRIASILANNPRWNDVAAQVQEHRPDLTPFEAQLEVKRILIATDERCSPELAEAFVAGVSEARRNVGL